MPSLPDPETPPGLFPIKRERLGWSVFRPCRRPLRVPNTDLGTRPARHSATAQRCWHPSPWSSLTPEEREQDDAGQTHLSSMQRWILDLQNHLPPGWGICPNPGNEQSPDSAMLNMVSLADEDSPMNLMRQFWLSVISCWLFSSGID